MGLWEEAKVFHEIYNADVLVRRHRKGGTSLTWTPFIDHLDRLHIAAGNDTLTDLERSNQAVEGDEVYRVFRIPFLVELRLRPSGWDCHWKYGIVCVNVLVALVAGIISLVNLISSHSRNCVQED